MALGTKDPVPYQAGSALTNVWKEWFHKRPHYFDLEAFLSFVSLFQSGMSPPEKGSFFYFCPPPPVIALLEVSATVFVMLQ